MLGSVEVATREWSQEVTIARPTLAAKLGIDADSRTLVVGPAPEEVVALATGLVDVKVAAIDENWSGLRFLRRLADRSPR